MVSLPYSSALPRFRRFLPALALLALSGCHQEIKDPHDPRFIVAEGQNWVITRGKLDTELATELKEMHKTVQDIPPAQLPQVEAHLLEQMVLKKLVLARAETLHINVDQIDAANLAKVKGQFPTDAEFKAKLKDANIDEDILKARIHEKDLVVKTLEVDAFKSSDPSDAEVNAFYEQQKDRLTIPEKRRANRVLVMVDDKTTSAVRAAKKKAIDTAHARVLKGEDFGKVASDVSEDQYSKTKGGDIGYFQKGENDPTFDQVAFGLKDGETSAVFVTPTGYEFIRLTAIQPAGVLPIAQVRDRIFQHLQDTKRMSAMENYKKKLMADNHVVMHLVPVNPDQLPGAPAAADTNAAPAATPH